MNPLPPVTISLERFHPEKQTRHKGTITGRFSQEYLADTTLDKVCLLLTITLIYPNRVIACSLKRVH